MTRTELLAAIDDLQAWFSRKPYGFTEKCSPDQLQQYRDRERELDNLTAALERMG